VRLLIVKLLIMPLLLFVHADHATAAVRAVAAREARFKGETAGAREAAASVAGAREATWSLVRLLLVQLLNMVLLLYVHLSLIVQFASTKS
jgi:cysteine synthase